MDPASWERVKDVLAEAVKLPAAERDAFVESQNLPPDLREKVLEILSAWKDTTPFLKTVPSTIEADVILRPGAIIGPYEINDLIGEGGMGRVYLANDRQLRRRVALKCLKGPADATIIKEAIAAAQLNHPNVAAVYHVIEQGQTLFIVMEYVDGENLAERLKRERLPMLQAVVIGQRLSSALAAAHSKGIIHRDLKPGNVQFTKDGTPKVLDFGIARLAQTMTVTSNASTTGQTVSLGGPHPGTPPYMSPEQLGGRDLDERSDIFSLGVLLFEMTTGRRPFPSSDRGELKELQAKGAPRADSVDPKVSRALADVIARSLDTDRLRRTQSALEVEAALEDVARRLRPKVIRELIRLWLARVAIGVPIALTGIVLAGFIVTVGFNTTFGRDAEFARFGVEPLTGYFRWGVLAVFPAMVTMAVAALVLLAARAVLRMLEAAGALGRAIRRLRARAEAIVHETGLDTSPVLAQTLAGFGIVAIIVLFLSFSDLVTAWSAFVNSAPIDRLVAIGPQAEARAEYHRFQFTLQVLTVLMGLGLVKVLQLRRFEKRADGVASVVALSAALAMTMVTFYFTYRTMNHRDFERVYLAGSRCYITGQTDEEFLVFCPQNEPPRNRAVKRSDEALKRTGIVENALRSVVPVRSGS